MKRWFKENEICVWVIFAYVVITSGVLVSRTQPLIYILGIVLFFNIIGDILENKGTEQQTKIKWKEFFKSRYS